MGSSYPYPAALNCEWATSRPARDAFYAQVEQIRLGLDASVPLCVQQWDSLIAVNYAARAAGIKRFNTIADAKELCPTVRLVHVATYANGSAEPAYHDNPSMKDHKVSLDVYRKASTKIMRILSEQGGSSGTFQRASIDEAYLDITDQVNSEILSHDWPAGPRSGHGAESGTAEPLVRWEDDPDTMQAVATAAETRGWADLQLFVGAQVCKRIRRRLFDELGYTCSAGIAHNKMLAKLVSATHKPNKQTVLRSEFVLEYMKTTPVSKIRGLGGKFGNEVVDAFQVTMASDLWEFTEDQLVIKLGEENGTWLYKACRGESDSKVQEVGDANSMGAGKSFRPALRTSSDLRRWIEVLSAEVFSRTLDEFEFSKRWPKTLVLHYRNPTHPASKSKSCAFPPRVYTISPDIVVAKALWLIEHEPNTLPCTRLGLTASKFEPLEDTGAALAKWLKAGAGTKSGDPATFPPPESPSKSGLPTLADPSLSLDHLASTEDLLAEPAETQTHTETPAEIEELARAETSSQTREQMQVDADDRTGFCIACDQCGHLVPADDLSQQEHSDFHVAQALSVPERIVVGRPLGNARGGETASSTTPKRPAARGGGAGSGGKRAKTGRGASKTTGHDPRSGGGGGGGGSSGGGSGGNSGGGAAGHATLMSFWKQ
ncbi:N-acetyltransferase eso1 [Polyrhizophydium stewartii]|uniref:DNA polymerase eta n=1 Tax=Polyrhizophydium stewartii TaxID=2732419 RepID=A0ABR4NDB8_9FUNG